MEQKDKDLIREVAARAREAGGFTDEDKAELSHLMPTDSWVYHAPDPYEGMSPEEKEEWLQLGREIAERNRARKNGAR